MGFGVFGVFGVKVRVRVRGRVRVSVTVMAMHAPVNLRGYVGDKSGWVRACRVGGWLGWESCVYRWRWSLFVL